MNRKGFTLVELLAVIAIIALLSIVIGPNIIKIFNNSVNKAMITQENSILDASKLYLEDYCVHPISDNHLSDCNSSRKSAGGDKVYFCLNKIKSKEYIGDIKYKSKTDCRGIVIYNYKDGKYADGKTHLYCGTSKTNLIYSTDTNNTYRNYAFASGC